MRRTERRPSADQALHSVRGLGGLNVVGMDVVEVSPPYEHAEITALLAATLAYDFICLSAARHKPGGRF